jgi:hypothetical protein
MIFRKAGVGMTGKSLPGSPAVLILGIHIPVMPA